MWNFKIASIATEGDEVKEGDPARRRSTPSEQMRELETLQNDADAAKKKLDKKRDDAALARRDEELADRGGRGGAAQGVAQDRRAGRSRRVGRCRRTSQLDEQLAKLALEQAKSKAAQAKRSDDGGDRAARRAARRTAKRRVEELQQNIAQDGRSRRRAPARSSIRRTGAARRRRSATACGAWRTVVQIVGLGKMVGERRGRRGRCRARRREPAGLAAARRAARRRSCTGTVESIAKSVRAEVAGRSEQDRRSSRSRSTPTKVPLRPGHAVPRRRSRPSSCANVVQVPAEAVFVTPDGPVAYRDERRRRLEA